MGFELKILEFISKYGKSFSISALIFVIGFFTLKKINRILAIFWKKTNIDTNVANLCNHLIRFFIYLLILSSVLSQFVPNFSKTILAVMTPLWASIVALGVIFKDYIGNIISGVFIIFLKSIHVGDYIEILSGKGKVIRIGYFCTNLLSEDGKTIIIPNSKIINEIVFRKGSLDICPINLLLSIKSKSEDKKLHQKRLRNLKNMLENYIFIHINDIMETPAPKMTFLNSGENETTSLFVIWCYKNRSNNVITLVENLLKSRIKDLSVEILPESYLDSKP